VAAIAILVIATPAGAQSSTGEVAYPPSSYPSSGALGVPVTATVQSICAFGNTVPTGTVNIPNVNVGLAATNVDFTVTCSSNFRVGVVSTNGALVASGVSSVPTGYSKSAPYQVALHLAGDSGATANAALCNVAGLAASSGSPCSFRGPASGTQGLELIGVSTSNSNTSYVQIYAPAYVGPTLLASNTYADTLTVTISAAP
jgi:hypothetical protein